MTPSLHLENERLSLDTGNPAGQMFSLKDKSTGRELLYQADQGWSGRNPTLFPMVGKTWQDGRYFWKGKTYQMKNHGLIRYLDLEGQQKGDQIRYTFHSNENTKSQYPFDFDFELIYTLQKNGVQISYAVANTGTEQMPFSFGLHPAFKTVQNAKEKFEDFHIQFSPAGKAEQIVFFSDLSPVQREVLTLDQWACSYADLEKYSTLVYDRIQAVQAQLFYQNDLRMTMKFDGFPSVALWNPGKGNDFICIEPWFGHSDFEKTDVSFDQREGTILLDPGCTFQVQWSIELPG